MYYGNLPDEEYAQHFFRYPHVHGMTPFRILGNLYFAGDDSVGIHLIDTGDGLILLDTGYPEMQGFTIQSIWALGFRPSDIRILLHTHAHFDHIGSTNLLKELSGAKTYLSAVDAQMMRERPELTYAKPQFLFEPDVALRDGDTVCLGNTVVRCVAAPGHTGGTMAFFFNVEDTSGHSYIAGIHGGVGLNTLSLEYVQTHHLDNARASFRASLERLEPEKVDILLGNHTRQNDLPSKYEQMLRQPNAPNPFIDCHAWGKFIRQTQGKFAAMLDAEQASK